MHGPAPDLPAPRRPEAAPAAPEEPETGIAALLRTLWRRRSTAFATMAVVLALAVAAIQALPARYEAAADILLLPRSPGGEGAEGSLPRADSDTVMLASEIEVMTSRGLLGEVVRARELLDDPAFNPAARRPKESLLRRLGLASAPAPVSRRRQHARAVDRLRGQVQVRPRGRARVIRVQVEAAAPGRAATLANALADRYIARRLSAEREAKRTAAGELREAVASLRRSLSQTEAKLARHRRRAGLAGPEGEALAAQAVAALADTLREARARHDEAELRLAQARHLLADDGVGSAGEVLESAFVRQLSNELAELRRRHAELKTVYGPKHPKRQASRAQIAEQRSEIRAATTRIVAGLRNEANVARRRVARLARRLAARESRIAEQTQARQRLAALEREAEAERQVFEAQLARLKRAGAAPALRRPDARILSRAVAPTGPSSPNMPLLLGLALLPALPCAVGAALLREQFDTAVTSRRDSARATGLPVLAAIPELRPREHRGSPAGVLRHAPRGAFAEAVHKLAGAVLLRAQTGALHSILVTSADTGEGKSTLALALARVLALRGERVLLIEADLRRPRLARTLGLAPGPGLAEVLDPEVPADGELLARAIRLDPAGTLHVLPAGGKVTRPIQRLTSPRLGPWLDALEGSYDRIVVDSPPTVLVGDAISLGQRLDTAVLALRWGHTPAATARWAVEELRRAEVDLVGVALTRIDTRRQKDHAHAEAVPFGPRARAYYH